MTRQNFVLAHTVARSRAMSAVANAPDGYSVEVKPPTRSLAATICGSRCRSARASSSPSRSEGWSGWNYQTAS